MAKGAGVVAVLKPAGVWVSELLGSKFVRFNIGLSAGLEALFSIDCGS